MAGKKGRSCVANMPIYVRSPTSTPRCLARVEPAFVKMGDDGSLGRPRPMFLPDRCGLDFLERGGDRKMPRRCSLSRERLDAARSKVCGIHRMK